MLEGAHPLYQALLGTLFTWGLTAAGSALVFVFNSGQRKILDGSLGFAAGVMTAASYWSLLAPAIELAEQSGVYGEDGQWAFIPAAVGFILGALFVYGADVMMPYLGINDPAMAFAQELGQKMGKKEPEEEYYSSIQQKGQDNTFVVDVDDGSKDHQYHFVDTKPVQRRRPNQSSSSQLPYPETEHGSDSMAESSGEQSRIRWKRILLLIIAITVHNIPEGLAVGVGFGAIGKTKAATFQNARNLAIGIGIQNFPEGLAVSLPLRGSGVSVWKSFWYGQLSGMVEPIAGIFGVLAVAIAEPILPYAMAFAAGAMIYVVFDDIIPEAQVCGNGRLASAGAVVGFVVMMSLDVGLG